MKIKRKIKGICLLFVIICTIFGSGYYILRVSPYHFHVISEDVSSSLIPDEFIGFKIGFFSDLDISTSADLDYLETCVEKINNADCDLVIFGGDIYENGQSFDQDRLISILNSIKVPYGKFAVLGENEFKANLEDSINLLKKGGFEILRNEVRTIYYQSSTITLVGMESSSDLDSLLTDDQENGFVITAIHQPDYFTNLSTTSMNLQLSGHTGGGFVQIPFFGPLVKLEGGKTYVSGRYDENDKTLIVSNGIGMGHQQQYRFNARPDAYVLTLSKRTEVTVSSSDATN